MNEQLTPKEQAEQLWNRINDLIPANGNYGINEFMALDVKATNEICNVIVSALIAEQTFCPITEHSKERKQFWEQVKIELNHE